MNFNKVFLAGNLTRDPELKYTPQGVAVCTMGIAVNRTFKGNDGEQKKEVQFFTVVVWQKQAENCGKYLTKGSPVHIEGRLQNRSWEKDGQKRTVTEIVAESVQFLGAPKAKDEATRDEPRREPQEPDFPAADDGAEVPF